MYKFQNLNQALIGMAKELLENGKPRQPRGFTCYEIPNPVLICIENPCDRYVTIPERKWNKTLPFVESLWLLLGLNDLDSFPGKYVKNLYNFSDDGHFWRAGYGPRLRSFTGNYADYKVSNPKHRNVYAGGTIMVDQLKYIMAAFARDMETRQAIIEIGDPAKDCFGTDGNIKVTKDFPCTRSLHLMLNTDGALDMIVDIRSNDILWGFSAVNVFNFTFMQEYIANMLNVPVGKYYHKADNLHYYDNFKELMEKIAAYELDDFKSPEPFYYKQDINSLEHLDFIAELTYSYEKKVREGEAKFQTSVGSEMFDDVTRVIYRHWTKDEKVVFKNPFLNKLFNA